MGKNWEDLPDYWEYIGDQKRFFKGMSLGEIMEYMEVAIKEAEGSIIGAKALALILAFREKLVEPHKELLERFKAIDNTHAVNVVQGLLGKEQCSFPDVEKNLTKVWLILGGTNCECDFDTLLLPYEKDSLAINVRVGKAWIDKIPGQPAPEERIRQIKISDELFGKIILAYKKGKDIESDVLQDLIEILDNAKKEHFSS